MSGFQLHQLLPSLKVRVSAIHQHGMSTSPNQVLAIMPISSWAQLTLWLK